MSKPIAEFQDSYRFLSNFWFALVYYEGMRFPSVEHAYQAAKVLSPADRVPFTSGSPGNAKRMGREANMRSDWQSVKLEIMEQLVRSKFEDPELRLRLLGTSDRELIEGNNWGDIFWGVCKGHGENHLGKILMKIRQQIKEELNA